MLIVGSYRLQLANLNNLLVCRQICTLHKHLKLKKNITFINNVTSANKLNIKARVPT